MKFIESETTLAHPSAMERLMIAYARSFPIRRGKLRVIESFWRMAAGNHPPHRLAVLKHGGLRMPCDLSEMLQRQFYFFGTYHIEEQVLNCWENAARGAKVIFDVGANAGIYSLAALAVQRDAIVHAFEPTPEIAARLRATAALNGFDQLYVHQVAVLKESGQGALNRFRGEAGTNEGMNFITSEVREGTERVDTVCLDRFCSDRSIDYVDLLKLDIQGQEHSALQGAQNLIRRGNVGMIFAELNWGRGSDSVCPASESIRLLSEAGYRFSAPEGDLAWREAGDWLRKLSDVVASRQYRRVDRR